VRELSCKALEPLFRGLNRKNLPASVLAEGIPYSLKHLTNRRERIEWSVYCRIIEKARQHFAPEDFEELGMVFGRSPYWTPVSIVARLLFTPMDCYHWLFSPQTVLRFFATCITPTATEMGDGRVRVTLRLEDGYEPCPEFFRLTKGALLEIPRAYGFAGARTTMSIMEREANYDIELPPTRSRLAVLRAVVGWPLLAWSAARHLKSAHEDLQRRYIELEEARDQLSRQATQLATVNTISQVVHRGLDLNDTLNALVDALVKVAGFSSAEVTLHSDMEGRPVERRVRKRVTLPGAEPIRTPLEVRGRALGLLDVCPRVGLRSDECQDLLNYLLPTLNMAIDNALTFTTVLDYRNNLERRVAERTAELAEARDHLTETVARLKDAQSVRERIFANINHEIRTPLSLITLAVAEIRKMPASNEPGVAAQLDIISANVRRLLDLVGDLLLLAAAREGKLRLRPVRQELGSLVRPIVDLWSSLAESHGLTLALRCCEEIHAEVDKAALERMVANFISNAVKFTPAGGRITVELRAEGPDQVRLEVADTGVGISPEVCTQLFERFVQGPPPVRPGHYGSGIGLSIVKELAEAHGGSVGVESLEGEGSQFFVILPRVRVAQAAALCEGRMVTVPPAFPEPLSVPTTPLSVVSPPNNVAEATVLVAEDDPGLLRAIVDVLRRQYRVLAAENGEQALRVAEQYRPDVLVTDIHMPNVDGLELIRRFRGSPGNRMAPVIVLTAFTDLGTRLSSFDAGAVDFVSKPFSPEELLARIRSQLAVRQMALRLHETEKMASIGVLSAGLAHEIRNPANVVANAVAPLKRLLPADLSNSSHPVGRLVDLLESNAQQMANLARDLLGFSSTGEATCRMEPLVPLIKEVSDRFADRLNGCQLRVNVDYLGDVWCQRPLLVQALYNIIDNAVYAAGETGEVRVAAGDENGKLVIDVGDTGPGVAPELRGKIFDPFFTTKPVGKGTGLGLTMAQMYLQRHGGQVSIIDRPCGAVFRLELPLKQQNEYASRTVAASLPRETRAS